MRQPGRVGAAIEILRDFEARRIPLKTAIADWSRANRYAGSKDRAWIAGLCLDALRKRNSLCAAMGVDTDDDTLADAPRALALGALRFMWGVPIDELAETAAEEPHGPGALTDEERQRLGAEHPLFSATTETGDDQPSAVGDYPEWLSPQIERVFGDEAGKIMAAFAMRADVDLRVNTLKATPEKALSALKTVKGEAVPILTTAARIGAPDPSEKAPAVTVIPAFNKGWVEVQDLGSQIAAAAAGDVAGAQVLDYCAGGGGKTLALAALMKNTGQLYAYDCDARRLKPLYARAKRAGIRNLQIINPQTDKDALDALKGKIDLVFVDAPCSGVGTWRRHPDTKWRLNEKQLATRMEEQDIVLRQGARFVRPGGRMVWVTCSFLMEENEDRLDAFLAEHEGFARSEALAAVNASGLLTAEGRDTLSGCVSANGDLRLTPGRLRADGFFISVLTRAG